MSRKRIYELALEAKKALGVLVLLEGFAVAQGLVSSPVDGYITSGVGVATAVLTYVLRNEKAPSVPGGKHEARRRA